MVSVTWSILFSESSARRNFALCRVNLFQHMEELLWSFFFRGCFVQNRVRCLIFSLERVFLGAAPRCAYLRAVGRLVLGRAIEVEMVVLDWGSLIEDHVRLVWVLKDSLKMHGTIDRVFHVNSLFE